ncbi:MAG TPA: hypothetical protein VHZ31_04855 [Solirubrobacteraceae bacterium]|nr:hypothetical protein [Solirubrobacteraceae bacterium]
MYGVEAIAVHTRSRRGAPPDVAWRLQGDSDVRELLEDARERAAA